MFGHYSLDDTKTQLRNYVLALTALKLMQQGTLQFLICPRSFIILATTKFLESPFKTAIDVVLSVYISLPNTSGHGLPPHTNHFEEETLEHNI
jgi:hypothetical protein